VLDQRRKAKRRMAPVAHRPDVVWAERDDAVEFVERSCHVRTGNHAPTRTIPVLDEGLSEFTSIRIAAHGPNIIRRSGVHCVQGVEPARAGA
jgi:hypothetical protein